MKKLKIILIFIFTTMVSSAYAQETREQRFERIHAVKIALITERLKLSSSQAESFWPIYNKYDDEARTLRRSEKANKNKDELKYQQNMLNLRKRYSNEFLKVISEKQLQDLYDAERDFKRLLLQRLKNEGENTLRGRQDR